MAPKATMLVRLLYASRAAGPAAADAVHDMVRQSQAHHAQHGITGNVPQRQGVHAGARGLALMEALMASACIVGRP